MSWATLWHHPYASEPEARFALFFKCINFTNEWSNRAENLRADRSRWDLSIPHNQSIQNGLKMHFLKKFRGAPPRTPVSPPIIWSGNLPSRGGILAVLIALGNQWDIIFESQRPLQLSMVPKCGPAHLQACINNAKTFLPQTFFAIHQKKLFLGFSNMNMFRRRLYS